MIKDLVKSANILRSKFARFYFDHNSFNNIQSEDYGKKLIM